MTFIEILTIYLTVGAPFGVYFFLKHRQQNSITFLALKSIAAAAFWIVYWIYPARNYLAASSFAAVRADLSHENQIENVSQKLQNAFALLETVKPTFFEFRETIERYIGLSCAAQNSDFGGDSPERELEFLRVAGRANADFQLAGRIFQRRNLLRLQAHQWAARQDFLGICCQVNEKFSPENANMNGKLEAFHSYQTNALLLAKLLEDAEAVRTLRRFETDYPIFKGVTENESWKKTTELSASLKTIPTTALNNAMTIKTSD